MRYLIRRRWGLWEWEVPNLAHGLALTKLKAKQLAKQAVDSRLQSDRRYADSERGGSYPSLHA
jgi:hypothetical protein